MEKSLSELAKLILKQDFPLFEKLIEDYNFDIEFFKNKYKKILIKWIDKDDFDNIQDCLSPEFLLEIYANSLNKMFCIDWSGEEYSGQIKSTLTKLLKTYNEDTFKWNLKEFEKTLNFNELRKGDYVALLFQALDIEVKKKGYQLLFIELYDDEYHYTILRKDDIEKALQIKGNGLETYNSKCYKIYLISIGEHKSKVMSYLKSKHNISLKEIKSYINNLPILMGQGYSTTIRKIEKELKDLGCKYEIK